MPRFTSPGTKLKNEEGSAIQDAKFIAAFGNNPAYYTKDEGKVKVLYISSKDANNLITLQMSSTSPNLSDKNVDEIRSVRVVGAGNGTVKMGSVVVGGPIVNGIPNPVVPEGSVLFEFVLQKGQTVYAGGAKNVRFITEKGEALDGNKKPVADYAATNDNEHVILIVPKDQCVVQNGATFVQASDLDYASHFINPTQNAPRGAAPIKNPVQQTPKTAFESTLAMLDASLGKKQKYDEVSDILDQANALIAKEKQAIPLNGPSYSDKEQTPVKNLTLAFKKLTPPDKTVVDAAEKAVNSFKNAFFNKATPPKLLPDAKNSAAEEYKKLVELMDKAQNLIIDPKLKKQLDGTRTKFDGLNPANPANQLPPPKQKRAGLAIPQGMENVDPRGLGLEWYGNTLNQTAVASKDGNTGNKTGIPDDLEGAIKANKDGRFV